MKKLITCLAVAVLAFGLSGVTTPSACAADSKVVADKTADCCSGSKPATCAAGKSTCNTNAKTRVSKILMSPKAMVLAGK